MHNEDTCGCGCSGCGDGCCEDNTHDTVTLSLDDGRDIECVVFKIFPAGDKEYIALLPTGCEEEETGEVFLYRFELGEDDEPILSNIENDEEYEIVADAFDELLDSLEYDEIVNDEDEE